MVTVNVGIASLKEREPLLLKALESLSSYPGVNIHLNLNEYDAVPSWIADYPIAYYKLHPKNGGDKVKFNFEQKGYCFSCDDDIEYPPEYIEYSIEKLIQYNHRVILSYMGKRVPGRVGSYYRGVPSEHFQRANPKDHRVDIPGTGVMAWCADHIRFAVEDFTLNNMADIYAGILARRQGLDVIHVAHPEKWFISHDSVRTIWKEHHRNDEEQTKLVNSINWTRR
jgi:hypothetical protein